MIQRKTKKGKRRPLGINQGPQRGREAHCIAHKPFNEENIHCRCYTYEQPRGKTNNVVSEQVRQQPGCTDTEKS